MTAMEEGAGTDPAIPSTAGRRARIQWGPTMDATLLRINELAGPKGKPGRPAKLLALWRESYPNFPSTAAALNARLRRLVKGVQVPTRPTEEGPTDAVGLSQVASGRIPSAPGANTLAQPIESTDEVETQTQVSSANTSAQQPEERREEDSESSDVSDQGNVTLDVGAGDQHESAYLDELREEFREKLGEVQLGGVSCFSTRTRSTCRGKKVDAELLTEVDGLISEEWELGEKSPWRLNCLVYAGASIVEAHSSPKPVKDSGWDPDLKTKAAEVTQLRRKIGWLTSEIGRRKSNSKPTARQYSNIGRLRRIFGPQNLREMEVQLEVLKCSLRIRALQLRRLKKIMRRRNLNRRYRCQGPSCLEKRGYTPNDLAQPDASQISEYWSGVMGVPGEYNLDDPAITTWQEEMRELPDPIWEEAEPDVFHMALKKTSSWKAPGRDCLHAFWWKKFPRAALLLWETIKTALEGNDQLPEWFVSGRTLLIPKKGCTGQPEQYRPITCLNVGYKLFTGVVTILLRRHVEAHAILPSEQKAIHREQRGCHDALLVDNMISESSRVRSRDLSVAWIDYKKAYDRVPHAWILRVLDVIKAPQCLRRCIALLIPLWKSQFQLGVGRNAVKADIRFRRGVYQGDSLSPLLFCLCLAPLSVALRRNVRGVCPLARDGPRYTHLLFMDDLKVYAAGKVALERTLSLVIRVSQAIGMELGLDKCAVAHK